VLYRPGFAAKAAGQKPLRGTACPGCRRGPPLVSRFLPTREQGNNRITLHRTTSAKTRATTTLRQRHIPPNVIANAIFINPIES